MQCRGSDDAMATIVLPNLTIVCTPPLHIPAAISQSELINPE